MTETCDLLVAGAGPAGLAHAFWRRRARPDLRVLVAEAAPRAGGWVRTVMRDGWTCEAGPQGFRPNADSDALLDALELRDEVVPAAAAAKRRWVVQDGRLVALPAGPLQLLTTPLFRFRDLLRLVREPWVPRGGTPDESMSAFLSRRFGPATRPLAEAMAHGIFAGDADRLEMRSMFPMAVECEERHGSVLRGLRRRPRPNPRPPRRPVLCSLRGGMERSIRALAEALGESVLLGAPVQRVRREGEGYLVDLGGSRPRRFLAREVALAIPAHAAAGVVAGLDATLAEELRGIRAASVVSVYVGAPRDAFAAPLDGFGFLAPKHPSPLLGVLMTGALFPEHAPAGHMLLRAMSGGAEHPDEAERSDAELLGQARHWLGEYLGMRGQPSFVHVERTRNAIAQYESGHAARLARIAARTAALPGLRLLGASYRQVSVVGQWAEQGSHP
ncbi:MAG: protoporphyrinogen oxidase [Planctomycetes bacterium]|nr:protoporphyrinogen oxidase [Planctomycetota bacterium]